MTISKPMLAVAVQDISKIEYPVLVSPKLDGIRCLIVNGKAVSRSFKPIPNHHIRSWLERYGMDGWDGEIIIPGKSFNEIQSAVMTEEGEPYFEYHVFDWVKEGLDKPFKDRHSDVEIYFMGNELAYQRKFKPLEQKLIYNPYDLMKYEADCLSSRYEGIMIRSLNGPYKCGRSTIKEGYLLKLKRFVDAEAVIIGYKERMHNANEAFTDELGHTKRSSHKANKVGTNMLGAFEVRTNDGIHFDIGTGFSEAQRIEYWNKRDELLAKLVKFKYQELSADSVPRFPVFLGFRDERDL